MPLGAPRAPPWTLSTADVFGIPAALLEDADSLAERLEHAFVDLIGRIAWHAHRFAPRGMSLIGTAARGRVIVHTWPEREVLTIDLYGEGSDAERVLAECVERLRS